jgi:hypothetical protein
MKQLNEFETLADAQAHMVTEQFEPFCGDVMDRLTRIGKYTRIKDIANEAGNPLRDAAAVCIDTLLNKATINVHSDLLGAFVAYDELTQDQADSIINMGIKTVYPYANTAQSQFNAAKGVMTEVQAKPGAITIHLKQDLPERVAVTFWAVRVGYEDENLGQQKWIQKAQKYSHTISNKHPGTQVVGRIPFAGVDVEIM